MLRSRLVLLPLALLAGLSIVIGAALVTPSVNAQPDAAVLSPSPSGALENVYTGTHVRARRQVFRRCEHLADHRDAGQQSYRQEVRDAQRAAA